MNNIRRKALGEIRDKLESIKGDIEMLRDEEQEFIDNMPENLQGGDKATIAENAVNEMDNAINSLEDACNSVDEAKEEY